MATAVMSPALEGVLVRVLGRRVSTSPSSETMEACAAVAKESRPEVWYGTRSSFKKCLLVTYGSSPYSVSKALALTPCGYSLSAINTII